MAIGSSAERIKILRVIGRLNVGGPAIHVVNLTAGLESRRYQTLLVAGSENEAEGSMLDFAVSHGVRPEVIAEIVTAFNVAPRDLKALWKLYSLMRRERPHIVHTHTAKAGFLGRIAARLAGVPVIIHTFHGHVLHGYYGALKNQLLRRLERWLAWMSDRLVTVSEQVKSELVGYGIAPADKITVVPLGFDLEPFLNIQRDFGFHHEGREDGFHHRDTEFTEVRKGYDKKLLPLTESLRLGGAIPESSFSTEAQSTQRAQSKIQNPKPVLSQVEGSKIECGEFRREMGLSEEHKLVGIIGRIFQIKNHALFLESAARMAARDPRARFVIVGDGILRSSLKFQARELRITDRVLFTGWRRDLPRICAGLDVLVLSSDNEGTPVSVIEAMAAGCPVVATRVGGLPDLIDDGRTGRLVPPRDPDALAGAVLDLLEDPAAAREMGNNAREFVRQRFTIQRLLGDMDRLYTELLAAKEENLGYTAEARSSRRFGKRLTKNSDSDRGSVSLW